MLRVIVITGLLLAATPGVARGDSWSWPVSGRVVGSFSFSPDASYAAGQRRGLAIAAAAGAPVRSACAGRVAFAGPVGRAGLTLSVDCGAVRATYQGLGVLLARPGEHVAAGRVVAGVDGQGVLRLGARVGRHHYLDPAALLRAAAPPLGPAPRPRRRPPSADPPPPAPPVAPRPAPAAAPPARPAAVPALAWVGLALAALAAPVGCARRRRRRRAQRAPRSAVPALQ